jgi:hypothetical protein
VAIDYPNNCPLEFRSSSCRTAELVCSERHWGARGPVRDGNYMRRAANMLGFTGLGRGGSRHAMCTPLRRASCGARSMFVRDARRRYCFILPRNWRRRQGRDVNCIYLTRSSRNRANQASSCSTVREPMPSSPARKSRTANKHHVPQHPHHQGKQREWAASTKKPCVTNTN